MEENLSYQYVVKLLRMSILALILIPNHGLSDANVGEIAEFPVFLANKYRLYDAISVGPEKSVERRDHGGNSKPKVSGSANRRLVSVRFNGILMRGEKLTIWLNDRPLELLENTAGIDTLSLHPDTNTLFVNIQQEQNIVFKPGQTLSVKSNDGTKHRRY